MILRNVDECLSSARRNVIADSYIYRRRCDHLTARPLAAVQLQYVTALDGRRQVKVKVSPIHATKAYSDSRGTAPFMLNLDTR
jgi:hypothetical protein